ANERPVEDSYRTGEHRLHRTVGERLRIAPPVNRHRLRPRHVAEQDRRAHAAGAITLHPAVAGEREAGELFAKILNHVIALELAMDEHVKADFLLPADGAC